MSDHFIGDAIDFRYFEEIFIEMGLDSMISKMDNKSIRIMNRLIAKIKQ